MANEKIEIDIVLNDGSIAKAFATINKSAKDSSKDINSSIKTTQDEMDNYKKSILSATDFFNKTFRENINQVDSLNRKLREADLAAAFSPKSFNPSETIIGKIADLNSKTLDDLSRKSRAADLAAAFSSLPREAGLAEKAIASFSGGFKKADSAFESFKKSTSSAVDSIFTLKNAFIGVAAAAGAFYAFNKVSDFIRLAVSQAKNGQNELNNLATSLKNSGTFSLKAVDGFKELASRIQETTNISEGQVISLAALARNYTKTNEQAKKLTEATIQLSAANGKDLNANLEFLGGTLQGIGGRLGKTIPGFSQLKEESLKAGDALKLVIDRFGGTAESKINTFDGAIERARNNFNKFLGDLGNQIIRNPTVVAAFNGLGDLFNTALGSIKTNSNGLKDIIDKVVLFGVDAFVLVARAIINVTENVDSFKLAFASVVTVLLKGNQLILDFDLAMAKLNNKFALNSESSKQYLEESKRLNEENKKSIKYYEDLGVSIAESQINSEGRLKSLTDGVEAFKNKVIEASKAKDLLPEIADTGNTKDIINKSIVDLDKYSLEAQKKLGELKGEAIILRSQLLKLGETSYLASFDDAISKLPSDLEIANQVTSESVNKQITSFKALKDKIVEFTKTIKEAIKTGLTNAIAQGTTALVTSLVEGGNAFGAFAGTALSIMGDLMIQIGTQIILTSQAMEALTLALTNPLGGAGLAIAAGIGLIAAGAFVKAIAGKLGGKSAAPGSSLTAPGTPATPVSGGGNISDNLDRKQGVSVVIQGDVFDSTSTGLRIANILKDQGFADAVVS